MNNKPSPVLVIIAKINLQLTLWWFSWVPLSFHQPVWGSSWSFFSPLPPCYVYCSHVTEQLCLRPRLLLGCGPHLPPAYLKPIGHGFVIRQFHSVTMGASAKISSVSTGVTLFASLMTSNHSTGLKSYLLKNNVLALLRTRI